jgi:hypothetical protein
MDIDADDAKMLVFHPIKLGMISALRLPSQLEASRRDFLVLLGA